MSFTEFTYQLVQGYDYLHLYKEYSCKLQMGGSDQWGNITTGTEMIRRIAGGEAYALTCPLITKADGGKFGKTEKGNIWLDPERTSPYQFYQFWINVSDADASRYIRIFTLRSKEEIEQLEAEHSLAPHTRILQKALANDLTINVHSESDLQSAIEASDILFGKGTTETLKRLDEKTLLSVFDGVPQFEIEREALNGELNASDFLAGVTAIFPSKGEARRTMKEGGVMINREKVIETTLITSSMLLNNRYILVQRGKKNYYLVIVK